jgi:hypothetical protein
MPNNRATTGLIAAGGIVLVALMIYALLLGVGEMPTLPGAPPLRVAVFYPDAASWQTFRRAARTCAGLGLADVLEETAEAIRLRDRSSRRIVAFRWYDESGALAARGRLRQLLESNCPPGAVVGSTNTALTAALAEELAEHARRHDRTADGPVLLVTAATAVNVPVEGAPVAMNSPAAMRPLLEIYPRTFRFCLDNARLAELVVRAASAAGGEEQPGRALIVVDPDDPFAADLARCFASALEETHEGLPIEQIEWRPVPAAFFAGPGAGLAETADRTARALADLGDGRTLWLVLTVQGDPARSLLEALRDRIPARAAASLRVLCGDGIGRTTLDALAGTLPFTVLCASSGAFDPPPALRRLEVSNGQVEAEVAAALLAVADAAASNVDLARALEQVRWTSDAPLGRPLAFADRERVGIGLGFVMILQPSGSAPLPGAPRVEGRAQVRFEEVQPGFWVAAEGEGRAHDSTRP